MLKWAPIDQNETFTYRWVPPVQSNDNIVSAAITVDSGDADIISAQNLRDGGLDVTLSNGVLGNTIFRGFATYNSGDKFEEYISINVIEKKPATAVGGFYGTAAGARIYWMLSGMAVDDDLDDTEIETDLRIATRWIDGKYRTSFPGEKVGQRAQLLEWPRGSVFDAYGYLVASDVIPREIESATYEAAWRHRQTPGVLSRDYTPNKYKSVSVDGAVSATFADFSSASDIQTQFATIDMILAPLIGRGTGSSLSGAACRV